MRKRNNNLNTCISGVCSPGTNLGEHIYGLDDTDLIELSFKSHRGRPGQRGGSQPKSAGLHSGTNVSRLSNGKLEIRENGDHEAYIVNTNKYTGGVLINKRGGGLFGGGEYAYYGGVLPTDRWNYIASDRGISSSDTRMMINEIAATTGHSIKGTASTYEEAKRQALRQLRREIRVIRSK